MASRGEVYRVKRRLGFSAEDAAESVVVLQDEALSSIVPTTVVAPLDAPLALYSGWPTAVSVSAREGGSKGPQLAIVHALASVRLDRLEPAPCGRLDASTLARIDDVLRLVLSLR